MRHLTANALLAFIVSTAGQAVAFEVATHRTINEAAAIDSASLDPFLVHHAGLARGLIEPLKGSQVIQWIGLGGVLEDQFQGSETLGGILRSSRHFHNPLLPWDRSGLDIPLLPRFESSVRWAQRADQGITGQAAWADARRAFFEAATGGTDSARQQSYADTFRILGQLMHLVADLAQPAHTRNDMHVLGDDLEKFIDANLQLVTGFSPFDRSIVQIPTADSIARVPVAHIWDTNRYDGANPPGGAASPTFGLAEISNANFFSQETISSLAYADPLRPLPAINVLDLFSVATYKTGENRPYRGKSGNGIRVDRMVAEGIFFRFLPPFISNFALDDYVLTEYASHLLPRAIGYSAGLLDYFFRGRIEIAPPARFAYGLAEYEPGNTGRFTKLRFKVRNATPGEDTGPGQLVALVQYRASVTGQSLVDHPFAPISSELFFAISEPIDVALGGAFQELTFDFSQSPIAIPTNAADVFLTVVFKGRLGLEDDAVMIGGKDLFEPSPIDHANVTDWECFLGVPYPVGDLVAYPSYVPPAQAQRDVNRDGLQDLVGPAALRQLYLKTFDLSQPAPVVSESHFDLSVPQQDAGRYSRVMVLQDQPFHGVAILARDNRLVASGTTYPIIRATAPSPGVYNHTVRGLSGDLVRRVLPSGTYRGLPFHAGFFTLLNDTGPCFDLTLTAAPALTLVAGDTPAE